MKDMEKLTIENLAPYLPYNLRMWDVENERQYIPELIGIVDNEKIRVTLPRFPSVTLFEINALKPILFPLSSLNKKKLIPIGLLIRDIEKYKATYKDNVFAIEDAKDWIRGGMKPVLSLHQCCLILDYLFSIKADVFGLIEKGLAIPVTNELNPY